MARPKISEATCEQMVIKSADRVFGRARSRTKVPVAYDGKYAMLCIIAANIDPTEAQMDAFQAAVEGLAGVHKAHIVSGGHRFPFDRVPAGHDLYAITEAGWFWEETAG